MKEEEFFCQSLWDDCIKCLTEINVQYSGVGVLVLQMGECCVQGG